MTLRGLGRISFRGAFIVYAAGLVLWLTLGLLPLLIRDVPAIGNAAADVAGGGGPLSAAAREMLHPAGSASASASNSMSMSMSDSAAGYLQYAFSLLNLVLGLLLIVRRPDELVPRLLALGLLGTAATFNLPSHEAFHILGSPWPIAVIHFTFHIVSGVAYLWAVILFPDGRLPERIAVPERVLVSCVIVVTAIIAFVCWWSDFLLHPQFFVVFFGILIPVAGVGAQVVRVADPSTAPRTRRGARLLIGALLPALALALIWCCAEVLAATDTAARQAADQLAGRLQDLFPAVFAIVPVVLFAGVLRYRLFDIDRLLSRVLVYALVVIGAGLVYLLAVVSGAALVQGASWWTVVVLAAAAVVLEPGWALAQRWANRIVFGQDLGPAEAIRTLISGLEQVTPAAELDQLVQVAVRATRATGAQLWLREAERWVLGAVSPPGDGAAGSAPVLTPGRYWPVAHQGERLGVLTVRLVDAETLPGGDRALLADLAAHAGLLVRNAVLARQLSQHVLTLTERARQLASSRRRLVAAQDRERRRVERDLHDGAQQALVAVILGMRSVPAGGGLAERAAALALLQDQLDDTTAELGKITSGALPSAVRSGGLMGGLSQLADTARGTGLAVDVVVDGLGQVADDAAAAVYFCCSEALQNVAKYAAAAHVSIDVRGSGTDLVFAVTDDGSGFDPAEAADSLGGLRGLDDRASLLGGWIAVDAAPGRGTRVRGMIPSAQGCS